MRLAAAAANALRPPCLDGGWQQCAAAHNQQSGGQL